MNKKEKKIPFWVSGLKLSALGVFFAVMLVPSSHRMFGLVTWAVMYYLFIAIGLVCISFAVSSLVTRYRAKLKRDAEALSQETSDPSSPDELDVKAI